MDTKLTFVIVTRDLWEVRICYTVGWILHMHVFLTSCWKKNCFEIDGSFSHISFLFLNCCCCWLCPAVGSCGRRNFQLMRTQSLNVLPLKPGEGQHIAMHATLTARDFFLAYFYPSGPFICIFSKTSPNFCCSLWLTHGSCVGPQNKIGHPAGCRFPCLVPMEYK